MQACFAAGNKVWRAGVLTNAQNHPQMHTHLHTHTHLHACAQDALVIAAKFDGDVHGEACRLAFYGRIVLLRDPSKPQELQEMRVFKVNPVRGT